MSSSSSSSSGGISFLGLLAIVFIVLKLTGFIAWSWWWVLAPLWGGLVLALVILGFVLLWMAVAKLFEDTRNKSR